MACRKLFFSAPALGVDPRDLRNLTNTVFRYRRKMRGPRRSRCTCCEDAELPGPHPIGRPLEVVKELLRQCHTTLINQLPEEYGKLRPEQWGVF